jgi:hypothetical protein
MRPDKVAGGAAYTAPTPAPKKQEPAPALIAAKPEPTNLPEMPAIAILDAEAEKRKKAYNLAASLQHGGDGRGGG